MIIIKQISTGKIIHREEPHSSLAISNASERYGIDVSDLVESDENFTAQQWTDRVNADKPWEEKMLATDSGMPRYLEDLITKNSLTMTPELQEQYDSKIALRATKPKE